MAYDGDEAGQHAIERGLEILEAEDVPAKVLYFPDGLDPDEFIRQRGLDAFQAIRPMTPTAFRMQRLRLRCDLETQEGRTEYAKGCAELLRKVRDPVDVENYLELLSVQTGFSRDVLIAQIGVTAPETPAQNNFAENREKLQPKRSRVSEGFRTEQTLLGLLAAGAVPRDTVKETDFLHPDLREAAKHLLNGRTPADIMGDENVSGDVRQAAGEAFSMLTNTDKDHAAQIAADCLRNLQIQRIQQEINRMTELMKTAETAEKQGEALKEVAALSKELARLKQQGR